MEEFKIELFEEENGKNSFPKFESLDFENCLTIQKRLKIQFEFRY